VRTCGMDVELNMERTTFWVRARFAFEIEMNSLDVKEIRSRDELEKVIMHGISLMDFSTPWCAPCCLQEPIIHRLAEQFEGNAGFARVNIDQHHDVVARLGIHSIPTLIIFKNSREIQRFVGLQSESALSEALRRVLA